MIIMCTFRCRSVVLTMPNNYSDSVGVICLNTVSISLKMSSVMLQALTVCGPIRTSVISTAAFFSATMNQ